MAGPNGIDDEGAERIGYIKALHGLIANREAVDASMARVRKAAAGYTDEELLRFAQLIIQSENAPSDWRERQLARLRGREDAIEEIAMSIDQSWLPTETDEEVFLDVLVPKILLCAAPTHLDNLSDLGSDKSVLSERGAQSGA